MASVAGPALGGLVVSHSPTAAYLLDAVCALIFFAFLWFVQPRQVAPVRGRMTLETLLAGVRFVWRHTNYPGNNLARSFRRPAGRSGLPDSSIRPRHFARRAGRLRLVAGAPAIGAVLVAVTLAHMPPMKHAGAAMLWAVAGFGVATIVFGLSRSFALSFLMLAATGGFDNISVVVRHTLVQMLPPENMRGRVSAVNNIFIGASNEIGGMESGLTGWLIGPIASVVAGGIGTLIVVAVVALLAPQMRRFGSLKDARPMEEQEPRGFDVIAVPSSGLKS